MEEKQNNAHFSGYMFVSFNTIKDKELFLQHYPQNFFDKILYFLKFYIFCCCISNEEKLRFYKAKEIEAYEPPEPEDIIWDNFRYSKIQGIMKNILVFLIFIPIMLISLGIVLGLTFLQDYLDQDKKSAKNENIFFKNLISFFIGFVLSIINYLIESFYKYVTSIEKQISRSKNIFSLSIKISIFTFLNSAFVPLISKYLVLWIKDGERTEDKIHYNRRRQRNNYLIDDMFMYFIINAIITPLLWTLDIDYILKKIDQRNIEKGQNPDENHFMMQKDLNELYLRPDMKLASKYSYLFQTTAMCLFYFPIFPLGFIIVFVGFIFGYFLEKFNYTHLYKRTELFDEIIAETYAYFFPILLFIGGIGDYFFLDRVIHDNKWPLINITVFGVLIIIPYSQLFKCNCIGIDKSLYKNSPLSEEYLSFYNDYKRQNPITRRFGFLYYISELKRLDYLSENAYLLAKKYIDKINIMEIYYRISKGGYSKNHQAIIVNSYIDKGNLNRNRLRRDNLANIGRAKEDTPENIRNIRKFYETRINYMIGNKLIEELDENQDNN